MAIDLRRSKEAVERICGALGTQRGIEPVRDPCCLVMCAFRPSGAPDHLESERECSNRCGLAPIIRAEPEIWLTPFSEEQRAGEMGRIARLDDCGHWLACSPQTSGSSESCRWRARWRRAIDEHLPAPGHRLLAPGAGGQLCAAPRCPSARLNTHDPICPTRATGPRRQSMRRALRWYRDRLSKLSPVGAQQRNNVDPPFQSYALADRQGCGIDGLTYADSLHTAIDGYDPGDGSLAVANRDGTPVTHLREVATQPRLQFGNSRRPVHDLIRPYMVSRTQPMCASLERRADRPWALRHVASGGWTTLKLDPKVSSVRNRVRRLTVWRETIALHIWRQTTTQPSLSIGRTRASNGMDWVSESDPVRIDL